VFKGDKNLFINGTVYLIPKKWALIVLLGRGSWSVKINFGSLLVFGGQLPDPS
jgi:hypothetical protein